jgi:hypothetical protein
MLLSSYFAIKENCLPTNKYVCLSKSKISSKLKKAIKELKVIEKLNASTNSLDVIIIKFNG